MKKSNLMALTIKEIAGKTANIACGSASIFGVYQPKEPKKLVELKKHK